ncbi:MAG TPA: RNA methyltransferase [Mycobacteriales bacterium]|nr:RNA methyltransferase [Mycobacteriales bacterium]
MDSPRNARVVAARALHSARGRRAAGAFLAEGPHAVGAALAASFAVREVFVTDEAAERETPLMRDIAHSGAAINTVTDRALRAVAETVTPQGVVAVVELPPEAVIPKAPRLVVVLERCSDPGNAGTVIRTADAVGADAVVLGAGSVDVWSGKCIRASAGSVFNVPVVTSLAVGDAVAALKERGCQVFGTAADGDLDLDALSQDRLTAATAWVFGSEAHGLGAELTTRLDGVVRIPISGRAESLNLAAAAAICLYSSARVRRLAAR